MGEEALQDFTHPNFADPITDIVCINA